MNSEVDDQFVVMVVVLSDNASMNSMMGNINGGGDSMSQCYGSEGSPACIRNCKEQKDCTNYMIECTRQGAPCSHPRTILMLREIFYLL